MLNSTLRPSPGNVYCIADEEYSSFWNGTIEATGINQVGNFTNQTDLTALYAQAPVMDTKYRELADRCLQGPNGTTLSYIGTASTVRDLVGIADAVVGPDSPINYWGLSYGTYVGMLFANSGSRIRSINAHGFADVGASFATVFPERVGRVILDGVIDATRIATTQSYMVIHNISSCNDELTSFILALARPN